MAFLKNKLVSLWFVLRTTKKPQIVFILSHMRSGSSLLEHILTSNKEIIGFGEQNRVYNSAMDIKKMELYIRWNQNQLFKNSRYAVDQVLHNGLTPNLHLLNNEDFKFIFLVRSPKEAMTSIENLSSSHYSINNQGKFNSINYYFERLNHLITIRKKTPRTPYFFLTYKELVENSDNILTDLSCFLELKTPLKKEYELKKSTGIFGDRSKSIKKGEIVKTAKKLIPLNIKSVGKLDLTYNKVTHFFNPENIENHKT